MTSAGWSRIAACVAVGAVAVGGWFVFVRDSPSPQLRLALLGEVAAVRSGAYYSPKLGKVGEWDSIFFVHPYSTPDEIEEALGFSWGASGQAAGLGDGQSAVLLLKGSHVVAWTRLTGFELDTSGVQDHARFARASARFVVTRPPADGGVAYLEPG